MSEKFELNTYLNKGVSDIITSALKASLRNPGQLVFLLKYLRAARAAKRKRLEPVQPGCHIPPFLIASISSKCNLFCKGCYARANQSCHENADFDLLTADDWNRIFCQAAELGVSFILLAGGEPLMRRDVIDQAGEYPNIIFPIFTNGTMLDREWAKLFRRRKNLIPILSLEGSREETDARRGIGVYHILERVMEELKAEGIFFGISITVTTENIQKVLEEEFVHSLVKGGSKVIFFVEYVPVTKDTAYLAPSPSDRDFMTLRLNMLRSHFRQLVLLSFPGDEEYAGGCLAAGRGFFHINADGKAEPCPFSPISEMNIKDHALIDVINSQFFMTLQRSGHLSLEHNGGCALFGKEAELRSLMKSETKTDCK